MHPALRADGKPRPTIGPDSRPLWEGYRNGRLLLPTCQACGKAHLPPGPVCPYCLSDDLEWLEASGRGVIASYVIVHKAWFPAFAADIPYNVVHVELAEGPRMTARVVDAPNEDIEVGRSVVIGFEMIDEQLTMPVFRLA